MQRLILFVVSLLASAAAFQVCPASSLRRQALLCTKQAICGRRSLRKPAGLSSVFAQIDQLKTSGPTTRPEIGKVRADDLVRWLWNEAQFDPTYPEPILDFFSDDIVYEDLVYKEPFVGKRAVIEFLQKTKDTAPPDFTFILDKVSDGSTAVGFTWHIELLKRPDAGKFANGCSFYELNDEGRICYIRDVVESPLKVGAFGLVLANLAAKAINMSPPSSPQE